MHFPAKCLIYLVLVLVVRSSPAASRDTTTSRFVIKHDLLSAHLLFAMHPTDLQPVLHL